MILGACVLRHFWKLLLSFALLGVQAAPLAADSVLVAVASNFLNPVQELARDFGASRGHRVEISSGSTGKLYAQIKAGAPYDVFLSADQLRPRDLEDEGFVAPNGRFTYAVGRLALWSVDESLDLGLHTLLKGDFRHLSMADPSIAPYGQAAMAFLERLGVYERWRDRIVLGENINQAYTFVATGNAEIGLLALSSVVSSQDERPGSRWEVPEELAPGIAQDGVLLARAGDSAAARGFVEYLQSPRALEVLLKFGYERVN